MLAIGSRAPEFTLPDQDDRTVSLSTLLNRGQRDRWAEAASVLVGDDFCDEVESGQFDTRLAEWR